MRLLALIAVVAAAFLLPAAASASTYVKYGVQDDAWLEYGPGTLDERAAELRSYGVDVVRVTIDWRATETRRGTYDWQRADALLGALHDQGIAPLVTLYGTPPWANGGRSENWAPKDGTAFAAFARAIARRFAYVHMWAIWNEPNQARWLRPTSAQVYVQRLLDPAYAAIHAVSPHSQVAGGVTAPRASTGGVSPVAWIAAMGAAHARLDAYAHNPYPLAPGETPTSGGCDRCATITMATLPKLVSDVQRAFGARTRIWLTEYGYQTNPPDTLLGVPLARQARYMSEAALRAYETSRVDVLIHYLVRDEPAADRWQSGVFTATGHAKPALQSFRFPLAQESRTGRRTVLWGQIRPGGAATYRLLRQEGSRWVRVGHDAATDGRGVFTRAVSARPGDRYRLWIPAEHTYSAILTVA